MVAFLLFVKKCLLTKVVKILFGFIRTSFSQRKWSICPLVPCSVTPKAYMSSVPAAEPSQKNESSKAYGSDQIQVFSLKVLILDCTF